MEGMKSNRPKIVKRVFEEITDKIFKSATIDKEEIIFIVRKMMDQISSKQIDAKELIRSEQLGKNPEDYAKPNDPMARKGRALGLRKGDNIEVYDADNEEGWTLNPEEISVFKYKKWFWKSRFRRAQIALPSFSTSYSTTVPSTTVTSPNKVTPKPIFDEHDIGNGHNKEEPYIEP